ncbi:MAG: LysR substrate-binding domain-containing protein [Pseudomonadota bacterium]
MPGPLPPLAALRAFEAAARHGSFTRAAQELHMSQASVSYQVKLLEERLGLTLFLRRPRQVTLTEDGTRLARPTIDAFDRLRAAYLSPAGAVEGTLSVSTPPSFASNWLAARIGRFQLAHPDLAVKVSVDNRKVAFGREEIDVAVRYGTGEWPGLEAHKVMEVGFTPMMSPALLATLPQPVTLDTLLALPLLSPDDPYWKGWLRAMGEPEDRLAGRVGADLGSQSLEGPAVMAGQAVAMLSPQFFARELEMGLIAQPFDTVATDRNALWLIYPESRRRVPKIAAFRKWLLEEAAA